MVGIPYDALDNWRSVFPVEVFIGQMERVAEGFEQGCELLERAIHKARGEQRKQLAIDLGRARAVAIHCASSANQAVLWMRETGWWQRRVCKSEMCVSQRCGRLFSRNGR